LGNGRKSARRLPLIDDNKQPVRSLVEARNALISVREQRKRNTLPQRGRRPTFAAFAAQYLQMASTRQKRKRTQEKEESAIEMSAKLTIGLAPVRPKQPPQVTVVQ